MKKRSMYLITSLIVLAILLVVFISKGIFPFGNNSLIWGDMHDQITAFYYHFYDSIKGNSSLLIDFSTSGGISFFGIMAYYILSPFTLLILLFPRSDIYLVVSIIVALKIVAASITCLYFLRTYFKKSSCWLSIFLAIIYAFSGYSLMMYQITPWMDIVYLFPLLVVGLKKVLDLEKPYMYIILLTISLILSFYLSLIMVIGIFFTSIIYIYCFKKKEDRKKAILALGISTVLSILISCVFIIPSYIQIADSTRIKMDLGILLNSKTGPLTDKFSMFMFGGLVYVGLIISLFNIKKAKKINKWFVLTLLVFALPLIIEPINKLWHFGSYACFPYRFGFMLTLLLIVGASYAFEEYKPKKINIKLLKKILIIVSSVISVAGIIFITYYKYNSFQDNIYKLSLSYCPSLVIFLLISTLLAIGSISLIVFYYKKFDKLSIILIGIITITHITCNSMIYLGNDSHQDYLMGEYKDLNLIEKSYNPSDIYRVKILNNDYILNSSMIMKYNSLDHFTSLTDRNNQKVLKKLGYSSYWTKTNSKGSTLFTDCLLANKYLISREKIDDENYIFLNKYGNEYFYESLLDLSYGYLINENKNILDANNSFEAQNLIYSSITSDTDLFEIVNDFTPYNITQTISEDKEKTFYEIQEEDRYNYLEKTIKVNGKKRVYLEILNALSNYNNMDIYEGFNIYVNDNLFKEYAIDEYNNGVIDLGTFNNEEINIKIEFKYNLELQNLTIGLLDLNKLDKFLTENKSNVSYRFDKNKINIKVKSDKETDLFIPIAYNDGFIAKNNNHKTEILKLYDNFIGIHINEGVNDITIKFIPKGFTLSLIVSIVSLIGTIVLFKTKAYDKLIDNNILKNIAYYTYIFLFIAAVFIMYFIMTICFVLSYFIKL